MQHFTHEEPTSKLEVSGTSVWLTMGPPATLRLDLTIVASGRVHRCAGVFVFPTGSNPACGRKSPSNTVEGGLQGLQARGLVKHLGPRRTESGRVALPISLNPPAEALNQRAVMSSKRIQCDGS